MSVQLGRSDAQRLVEILAQLPDFASPLTRRRLLDQAYRGEPLAGRLLGLINLEGAPRAAASEVVERVSGFGQLAPGQEALGLLVNQLLISGVGGNDRAFLLDLFAHYPLGTIAPEAQSPIPAPVPRPQPAQAQETGTDVPSDASGATPPARLEPAPLTAPPPGDGIWLIRLLRDPIWQAICGLAAIVLAVAFFLYQYGQHQRLVLTAGLIGVLGLIALPAVVYLLNPTSLRSPHSRARRVEVVLLLVLVLGATTWLVLALLAPTMQTATPTPTSEPAATTTPGP